MAKGTYTMKGGSRTSVGSIVNLGGGVGSNEAGTRFFRINAKTGRTLNRTSASNLTGPQKAKAKQLRVAKAAGRPNGRRARR